MDCRSMGLTAACLAAIAAQGACSLVYDPDKLSLRTDAGGSDDGDANGQRADASSPAARELAPSSVREGTGSSGQPIPLVIHGTGLAQDLVVESSSALVSVERVDVAADGTLAAAALRVAVDPELAADAVRPVELSLSQAGFSDTIELDVVGLAELELAGEIEVGEQTFDAIYSQITTEAPAVFTGEIPVRLVATGSIVVSHDIDASGGLAGAGEPGPGGCAGGAPGADGACEGGGGGATGSSAGGGGAGHAADGQPGAGPTDALGGPGPRSGNAMLTPLGEAGNRGHGGGGGNRGGLETAGSGGGGGGVLELSAGGDVEINSRLASDGATGGVGDGTVSCGGGGGGGSGGAILLRVGGTLSALGGSIVTRGAAGGSGEECSHAGGDGADGRIRIDVGRLALPADLALQGAAVRGPQWDEALLPIVDNSPLTIGFFAEPGFDYVLEVDGEAIDQVSPDEDGTASVSAELAPGLNEVCLVVPGGGDTNRPESRNCRSIAFIR